MIRTVVLLAILKSSLGFVDRFTWSECDVDFNRSIEIYKITVSPMPVVIPGPLRFGFDASVTKPIDGVTVDLDIRRHVVLLGDVHIPCVLGLGSCSYDYCSKIESMSQSTHVIWRNLANDVKAVFNNNEVKYTCPIPAQSATVSSAAIQIADIGSLWRALVEGDYSVKATIKDRSGAIQGCFAFKMGLTAKLSPSIVG